MVEDLGQPELGIETSNPSSNLFSPLFGLESPHLLFRPTLRVSFPCNPSQLQSLREWELVWKTQSPASAATPPLCHAIRPRTSPVSSKYKCFRSSEQMDRELLFSSRSSLLLTSFFWSSSFCRYFPSTSVWLLQVAVVHIPVCHFGCGQIRWWRENFGLTRKNRKNLLI